MTYRLKTFLQILVIFVIPITLLGLGIVPLTHQAVDVVLGIVLFLIIGIAFFERIPLKELGIRKDNIRKTILPYLLFTLAGVAVIFLVANYLGRHPQPQWWLNPHFGLLLFIPISIVQQFAFQGVLMAKLRPIIHSPYLFIFTVAALYAYFHVVFPPFTISFPFAFIAGVGFAAVYFLFPNLILISLSHIVLNFFAVLYCFFTFTQTC